MKNIVKPRKDKIDLFLEKLPPFMTWGTIVFIIIGSVLIPDVVAIFVISFNVFFLYRSIAFTIQFIIGLWKLKISEQINWQHKLEVLENISNEIKLLERKLEQIKNVTYDSKKVNKKLLKNQFFAKIIFNLEKIKTIRFLNNEIKELKGLNNRKLMSFKDLYHVILIPFANEGIEILDDTLSDLAKQTFPTKQIYIVLGSEARFENGIKIAKKLKEKYKDVFGDIWISRHILAENEIVGKSSNMLACGKVAKENIDRLKIDYKKITVTSCDADSNLPKNYFSYLSYKYITTKDREYKFYTGAILLYANIWRLDFFARIRNSMASMYNVGKLMRTDKLVPFSTYSLSFWLVDQIGYWTPWITPEDFHLFFKATFTFPKKVSTIPLFTKIMVDAAEGDNIIDSFKNNYYQSRRWQWGVSDDGWVIRNLFRNFFKIPLIVHYRAWHVIFDHILAPTTSVLLLVGANLPPMVNPKFGSTVFGARLPGISSLIIRLTLVFFIIAIIFDTLLRPRRGKTTLLQKILTPLEWIVNPLVGLFLTSIPGLEAHTRLLFGKYLEYYVTKKKA